MKAFTCLTMIIAYFFLANPSLAKEASPDLPTLERASQAGGIDLVAYPTWYSNEPPLSDGSINAESIHTEAWEIIKLKPNQIFLNYSGFPFGEVNVGKDLVPQICYAKKDNLKIFGVSERPERLKKAMLVVLKDSQQQLSNVKINCETMRNFLSKNSQAKTLEQVFERL